MVELEVIETTVLFATTRPSVRSRPAPPVLTSLFDVLRLGFCSGMKLSGVESDYLKAKRSSKGDVKWQKRSVVETWAWIATSSQQEKPSRRSCRSAPNTRALPIT